MDEKSATPEPAHGLSENLLREVLRTPPLKELILLQMKGIDPDSASGLVRTMMWEDPDVSMSLFGSLPDMVNWLVEFLLELGRQLGDLPEPFLGEILKVLGEDVDRDRLKEILEIYARLIQRLILSGEDSGGQALPPDQLDAESLGRVLNRLLTLSNAARRSRKVTAREQFKIVLSQLDRREVFTAAGDLLKSALSMGWAFITWSIRSLIEK
ncbi:MAG: hypothetical protein KKB90_07790 [Actinobacteria bacterium]|nr:hypothetical protein [Actinomycetota bacterium]MCG2819366.1 hypothetical protein [Actinomycetes bacterium]MBU4179088.1 hypothetical protein [Actinomycetota bacterium]MBU4218851.1 hypothetical protein [Actinomycetota bacterium]MBU4358928.1 hypothetical protein [Actinomycetota bacterium]